MIIKDGSVTPMFGLNETPEVEVVDTSGDVSTFKLSPNRKPGKARLRYSKEEQAIIVQKNVDGRWVDTDEKLLD